MIKEIKLIKKVIGAIPPEETHYRIARNGLFLALNTDWVDAVVPAQKDLQFEIPDYTLKIPLPGSEIFFPVLCFFHTIWELYHTEAAVLLHFSMTENKWAISVPLQEVSISAVHYDMTDRLPGYRCVGTMHSHGRMRASHSMTDRHDEQVFDGLHITIGTIQNLPRFDMDAELIVRGHAFKIAATEFPNIINSENIPQNGTAYRLFWGEEPKFTNAKYSLSGKLKFDEPIPPACIEKVKPMYPWSLPPSPAPE